MKVKISVTQEDINKGVRNSCSRCPIALAIERTLHPDAVMAAYDVTYVHVNGVKEWVKMPRSAARFINRFDKGKPVKPFNFILNVPDHLVVDNAS